MPSPTHDPDRRTFLGAAAVLPLFGVRSPAADPASATPSTTGLILRDKQPLNLEMPTSAVDGGMTPTSRFFVRSHFAVPAIDAVAWKLTVDGEVDQKLSLSLDDLKKMKAETRTLLLECAGNGRAQLVPKAKGLNWECGAVGQAEWTGVPLSAVLDKAGVKKGAAEVMLTGADTGEVNDEPKSPGAIPFERGLPLAKALKPEVLLAYRMNGKDLTREHGFPVRAVVGGWYGMAAVKWLTRISVSATPFDGYWQTLSYAYWKRANGRALLTPVADMQVKAQIAKPGLREVVPAGKPFTVTGAAWAGESEVAKVEVSADDGKTWAEAKLLGEPVPFGWRAWEWAWDVPKAAGRYRLLARATDTAGRTQPDKHDRDRGGYMINFVVPVEVEVG